MSRSLIASLLFVAAAAGPQAILNAAGPRFDLDGQWEIQSTAARNGRFWYPARVPSTVVANLVDNRVLPDPYSGLTLRSFPGMDYGIGENFSNQPMEASSPYVVSWWYRNRFTLPETLTGSRLSLRFESINYRANIWLNGRKLADSADVRGMYRAFELDITDVANRQGLNLLSVEVFPPTDKDFANNFVDWHPMPPDKNMGITGRVSILASGPVTVRNTQVVSKVAATLDRAQLTLWSDVRNGSDQPVDGTLTGRFGSVSVSRAMRLNPGEARRVKFDPAEFPQLSLSNPALWWPHEMGPQNLQQLDMSFQTAGEVSDAESIQFGIREFTSELDTFQNRVFKVNGKRILVRGGGWTNDMLFRIDDEREEAQLKYVRDMNLNTLRLEGQMMSDHFFETADRLGLMVMPGWTCCSYWEKWDEWSDDDYTVAAESLRNQVRRLRNHASVFVFMYGSFMAPPLRAEQAYLDVFRAENWPNPALPAATDRETPASGRTGIKNPGPYEYVPPNYWLTDKESGGAWGFVTEATPGAAVPVRESLETMFPAGDRWPIGESWDYHTGGDRFRGLHVLTNALERRYGIPKDLGDFVRKSQAIAYEGERAMFEAFRRNKDTTATGVIHWLMNNGWPSLIWHLFDYYSRPGGGYFGAKKGNEPVHAMYSFDNRTIVVLNSLRQPLTGYSVTARVLNFDLTEKYARTAEVDVPADGMARPFALPQIDGLSTTYFLRLTVTDPSGAVVSRNFYWLSTQPDVVERTVVDYRYEPVSQIADLTALEKLPPVTLTVSSNSHREDDEAVDVVTVTNPSNTLAFGVHLTVRKGIGGEDVAPILWDDNYFELLPGETRRVSARYAWKLLGGTTPVVQVDGWNVAAQ